MDKKGAKGYWISTSTVINQELFAEYVEKVGPWLKEVGGEVFAKDTAVSYTHLTLPTSDLV